jgi:hypothetical protein
VTAADLLERAQAAGIELIPNGDKLKLRADEKPSDALLAELRAHKRELLALLDTRPRRYAYRFRLYNGAGGGTYLTDTATLEAARNELAATYGNRLAVVARA